MLTLREIEYFTVLAEELHFGRAAERLFIAQSVLSRAVQRLESKLGVALFLRSSRTVALTAAGRALLPEALQLLDQGELLRRHARLLADRPVAVGELAA